MPGRVAASRALRMLIGAHALVLVCGCSGTSPQNRDCDVAQAVFSWEGQEVVLELVACALQDTYSSGAVPIFIGVKNASARPQVVRSSFDVYGGLNVQMHDPDGQEMEAATGWEPLDIAPRAFQLARHLLAREGISGRVVDLACDGSELEDNDECMPLYEFRRPGTYTVTVRSTGTYWCAPFCVPNERGDVEERPVQFPPVRLRLEVSP